MYQIFIFVFTDQGIAMESRWTFGRGSLNFEATDNIYIYAL